MKVLLLMAGDVEENPGPLWQNAVHKLLEAIKCLPKLLEGQEQILVEFKVLQLQQKTLHEQIEQMAKKVEALTEGNKKEAFWAQNTKLAN